MCRIKKLSIPGYIGYIMKISKITISFLLVLSLFFTGCETVKDITDPLDDDNDESNNISSDTIEANVE